MVVAAIAIIGGIVLVSVGLALVEFRKITPLSFRCRRCDTEFRRPPQRDYPRRCPGCGADDWHGI